MGTFVGRTFADPEPKAPAQAKPARKGRPKKDELIAMAREMGIAVPEGATIAQIVALMDEAEA